MTAALEGVEWSAALPGRTLPPLKTRYPFYRRLGGPQDLYGQAENLVPTGIRSRTVQPVVSRTRIRGELNEDLFTFMIVKGKVIRLQARCGPEDG